MKIKILLIVLLGLLFFVRGEEGSSVSSDTGSQGGLPPNPCPFDPTDFPYPSCVDNTVRGQIFYSCASQDPSKYTCPHPLDHSAWYKRFYSIFLSCDFDEMIDYYTPMILASGKQLEICKALAPETLLPDIEYVCDSLLSTFLKGMIKKFQEGKPDLQCNRKCMESLLMFTYENITTDFIACTESIPISNDILIAPFNTSVFIHPRIVSEGLLGMYSYYTIFDNGTVFINGQQTGDYDIEFNKKRSPLLPYNKIIKHAVIENGNVYLGSGIFYRQRELESVVIPSSTLFILNNTFYGCIKLKSVELPFLLQQIGMNPFYGCLSLETITMGIGYTLNATGQVTYVKNPCMIDIQNEATKNISRLVGAIYNKNPLGQNYCSHDNVLYTRDNKGVYIYAPGRKVNGTIPTTYTIREGTLTIGYAAFAWTQLEHIEIPDSVNFITACAFELNAKLKYFKFPYKVQSIQPAVLLFDISVTRVDIPGNIFYIGQNVFTQNYALDDIRYYGYNYPTGASCDKGAWDSYSGKNPIFMNEYHNQTENLNFCGMKGLAVANLTKYGVPMNDFEKDHYIPADPKMVTDYAYRMCLFIGRATAEGLFYKNNIQSQLATGGINLYDDMNQIKYHLTPLGACSAAKYENYMEADLTAFNYGKMNVSIVDADDLYHAAHHLCCTAETLQQTMKEQRCVSLLMWVMQGCLVIPRPPSPPTVDSEESIQEISESDVVLESMESEEADSETETESTTKPEVESQTSQETASENVKESSEPETPETKSSEADDTNKEESSGTTTGEPEQTKRNVYEAEDLEETDFITDMFKNVNFDLHAITESISDYFSDTKRHEYLDNEEEAQMNLPHNFDIMNNVKSSQSLKDISARIKEHLPDGVSIEGIGAVNLADIDFNGDDE